MSKASLSTSAELCLACCGSLPPTVSEREALFVTSCCRRPICQRCLGSNPRLSRFNPCLACLSGVRAVERNAFQQRATSLMRSVQRSRRNDDLASDWQDHGSLTSGNPSANIDGSLKDEDIFVLGDDDDNDNEIGTEVDEEQKQRVGHSSLGNGRSQDASSTRIGTPPPAYTESDTLHQSRNPVALPVTTAASSQSLSDNTEKNSSGSNNESSPDAAVHNKHYIQKSDTLLGIALKYGLDGLSLCKLNNLPPSALRTTPQLLHTRTFLKLPSIAKVHLKTFESAKPATDEPEDPEWAHHRALERAAKRFQLVTKEEDWRIANAYVVIASSSSASAPDLHIDKEKNELRAGRASTSVLTKRILSESRAEEPNDNRVPASTTARAVDAYLDDDEWEAEQLAAGRRPPSTYTSGSKPLLTPKSSAFNTRFENWTWTNKPTSSREKQA